MSVEVGPIVFRVDADSDLQVRLHGEVIAYLGKPDQAALHRYLSGVVLPKVERVERTSGPVGVDFMEPISNIWARVRPEGSLDHTASLCSSPTEARTLAACLLAAADEAEGERG